MPAKSIVVFAASAALGLSACDKAPGTPNGGSPTPQPTATVVQVVEVPTPEHSAKSPAAVEVMQKPTPCGAEKLQNYLNLLPTATAKDEIAKTLGHNRVRYIGLQEAKASASPSSTRVTGGLGVDGRIKEFACG